MARRIKRKVGPSTKCECRSGSEYVDCCEPYHLGKTCEDPQTLLRTRYCAYARGLADYVMETTDADGSAWWHDEASWRSNTRDFSNSADFGGFRILEEDVEEDRATLKFKALIKKNGRDISMVETSKFLFKDGRWIYHSGVVH